MGGGELHLQLFFLREDLLSVKCRMASTVCVFWSWRSVVVVLVSFAGALGYAVLNKSLSDKWYLWLRSQHPPWSQHR